MRILLLTPMPPDRHAPGAIPVLLEAALAGLAERHAVTLVTVAGPDPRELAAVRRASAQLGVAVLAAERRPLTGRTRWARRRRLAQGWLTSGWPWRTVWFWQPRVQQLLDGLAAGPAFDVIVADDDAMGIYRLPRAPLRILTEQEVQRPAPFQPPPASPTRWPSWAVREADRRRLPAYQRAMWRRFDVVQTYTERDAAAVRARAPELADRVRVNPFAITLPPVEAAAVEPDSVVFLGNFTHPPNVDAALWLAGAIMPALRRLRPQARLSLVGAHAPPEVQALEGPGVRVLGFVADADGLLRRSAVVLAPVRIGGGMRMKVLHAMALGKAVVTTSRGAEGLTAADQVAPFVVADDADAIAETTARLLGDDAARADLGERARAHVAERYSPQSYALRLEELCERELDRAAEANVTTVAGG